MGVLFCTIREAMSRLRSAALDRGMHKLCWQEGTLGFGGGTGPGPHYRRPDCYDVVSPSEEELTVLFLLSRTLRPECVVEYGTGTGASTACLAMGSPRAKVYTADLCSPNDLSGECKELWRRLGLQNIRYFREDWSVLPRAVKGDGECPTLFFLDGSAAEYPGIPDFPGAGPKSVFLVHDFTSSVFKGEVEKWWLLDSSALLAFRSPDAPLHEALWNLVSLVVPIERFKVQ